MKLNTPTLTPDEFVKRWQHADATERQSYQEHFRDVCRLVGAVTPGELQQFDDYTFEYGLKKTDGRQGYADVFYRNHFAIEYKGKDRYKDLTEAYRQLQQYRENLNNPYLLIVCDIDHWEIRTNFSNTPVVEVKFAHADLLKPHYRAIVRRVFSDPASFHPEKNKLQITEDVAGKFKSVVDETLELKNDPDRVARFMTKLVFCMFVEDIGLLPKRAYDGILTEIVRTTRFHRDSRDLFARYIRELFDAMATGGNVQMLDIPYFNGSMFAVGDDDIVPLGREALNALDQASDRNWAHVEPSVFGTIFERTLDKQKRAQLGAHYTHPDDIKLIVEPVLMQPLRRAWTETQAAAAPLRDRYLQATNAAERLSAQLELTALRTRILDRVRTITVLDPACGSGNFLYVSLRLLLDLEKEIITHPAWAGLPKEDIRVHPRQLYGMEINEIAHALASVVVWIGYYQWREDNGFFHLPTPILSDMRGNIVRQDAILAYTAAGTPLEPEWHAADVIVGNPPFLGGNRIRAELGDKYVDDLFRLYAGRIGATADLVTYWFERARAQLEAGKTQRVGLLTTNSIRGGVNREVLKRIKDTGDIFMAWADRPWVLDGASVRVSMVGFDKNVEKNRVLDGKTVDQINSDLTSFVDITSAPSLLENRSLGFRGNQKGGAFDIDEVFAQKLIEASNSSGTSNRDVVKKWWNGEDMVNLPRKMWLIDFGLSTPIEEARKYAEPFEYIEKHVKPERDQNNRRSYRERWWLHMEPRPSMRRAIAPLSRYIVTPHVSKHRVFVWLTNDIIPDHQLIVFAREDDYFFGVLHSRLHELWSLRMGTSLEDRPRYTPTTTFETFPFPFVPGTEDFTDPRVMAISAAAKALHEERHAWLNPPELTPRAHERTLTNLYNALQAQRGLAPWRGVKAAAAEFAPRLLELHAALDHAVIAAYGWEAALLTDDEALLRGLLALNGSRSGA